MQDVCRARDCRPFPTGHQHAQTRPSSRSEMSSRSDVLADQVRYSELDAALTEVRHIARRLLCGPERTQATAAQSAVHSARQDCATLDQSARSPGLPRVDHRCTMVALDSDAAGLERSSPAGSISSVCGRIAPHSQRTGPILRDELADVEFPSLPVQRRIAGILSAYDELIENSQRRIQILEADGPRPLPRVVRRVPLPRPREACGASPRPLGAIPEGWEVKPFSTWLTCQRQRAAKPRMPNTGRRRRRSEPTSRRAQDVFILQDAESKHSRARCDLRPSERLIRSTPSVAAWARVGVRLQSQPRRQMNQSEFTSAFAATRRPRRVSSFA